MKLKSYKIPLEIIEMDGDGYHLLVKCKINKLKNCNLVIDTGASKTVFDKSAIFDFVEIIENDQELHSAGINADFMESYFCNIKNLTIVDFKINNFQSVLIDLTNINELYLKTINKKLTGLIGGDFLMEYNAVIDYKKKILKLSY
ncbi:MAG: hypothetical protein A2046_07965 [Bacteroidetes bacterium GWA2_30_7]|nr:MAG: hypothetical protein A2046_07965 [Bacteroidetes bacterium GWA2_30_7]